MKDERISLAHGSGGKISQSLVEDLIYPIFNNNGGHELLDAALLTVGNNRIAMTTDSFVVSPIFFPGGDIGKLAACGTINDLAVSGASPKYMSVGLVVEEGFLLEDLRKVLVSLSETASEAGVSVVTGDTKVVEKGSADKIYINTTGIGVVPEGVLIGPSQIAVGDLVVVSGTLGDHGMTILSKREGLSFGTPVVSDCAPLNELAELLVSTGGVSCMRDPTRGGAAAVLSELAKQSGMLIEIQEDSLPVHPAVIAGCDMLGLDPLYLANEGKLVVFFRPDKEQEIIDVLRNHSLGLSSSIIGKVVSKEESGKVLLETELGAKRVLTAAEGEHLPRIC